MQHEPKNVQISMKKKQKTHCKLETKPNYLLQTLVKYLDFQMPMYFDFYWIRCQTLQDFLSIL